MIKLKSYLFSLIFMSVFFVSCIATQVRLPTSVKQVVKNENMQQLLLLAAQNNILFHIPNSVTREAEKSEIDAKCKQIDEPLWAEKLSIYLGEFQKRPELLSKFHIIELKRGDVAKVQVEKDLLDGAVVLSVQFVKVESHGKVGMQTQLPCSSSLAEYLNKNIIKTTYDFPSIADFNEALVGLPEKKNVARMQFSNKFLTYLAERGVIFKFNHEISFEKTSNGEYAMVKVLNQLGEETDQPFHQYFNYWIKQISEQSLQAQLIQMFAVIPDKELKSGIRVDSEGEQARKVLGDADSTYLFTTYNVENNVIKSTSLNSLDQCLRQFTEEMTKVSLRKPAATEKESYLRPGYICTSNPPQ